MENRQAGSDDRRLAGRCRVVQLARDDADQRPGCFRLLEDALGLTVAVGLALLAHPLLRLGMTTQRRAHSLECRALGDGTLAYSERGRAARTVHAVCFDPPAAARRLSLLVSGADEGRPVVLQQADDARCLDMPQLGGARCENGVCDRKVSVAEVQLDRGRVFSATPLELPAELGGAHRRADCGHGVGVEGEECLGASEGGRGLGVGVEVGEHVFGPRLESSRFGVAA